SNTSFKKLYAPKDVQQNAEFIKAKDFLKFQAEHNDIYVKIIEEINEIEIPVKKFFIEVKDLFDSNVVGKTKTKVLSAEQLAKATLGAIKIKMGKAKQQQLNEMEADINEAWPGFFGTQKPFGAKDLAEFQKKSNKVWSDLFGTNKNPFDK
ncbi:MAG: hypothetical protein PHV68_10380, partial [Candidatus Gastranaerophilales bacterium]|nr:hypothetical protein [Candidatus Gastranaerophilales bacterium]